MPLHLIPANIYLTFRFIYAVFMVPDLGIKLSYLKAKGIVDPAYPVNAYTKEVPWITQGMVETDFPLVNIPSNVVSVGPIYLSTAPAAEQDPELAAWLKQAPTVLINLGSMIMYNEERATEMAGAIKKVLDQTDVQILWKFNKVKEGQFGIDPSAPGDELSQSGWEANFLADLSDELANGRLRLERWLSVDPASLIETGDVVLFVHHGGASCYNEAVGYIIPSFQSHSSDCH